VGKARYQPGCQGDGVNRVMKYWNMPVAQAVSEVMKLSAVQTVSRQICVPLCMLVALPVMAGDEWTQERSDGDIRVFSKRTEGSPLKEFRGECEVPASLEAIRSLMQDHDSYQKWFAMTRRITLARKASITSFTVNYVVPSPWPAADRETEVAVSVRIDEAAGKGVVLLDALRSGGRTGKNGLVRINDMRAKFVFTRVDGNRTGVVLYMRVDPRIDMPAAMQNDVLRNYPLDTLKGLKNMAAVH